MTWIALKMLTANRARYYLILFGVSFATLLMTQQASAFLGILSNTVSQISDIRGADIWVMDRSVEFIGDTKPLRETDLYRVRGVCGVAWAVRLSIDTTQAQLSPGHYKLFSVVGLDDQTLVGRPGNFSSAAPTTCAVPTRSSWTSAGIASCFPGSRCTSAGRWR